MIETDVALIGAGPIGIEMAVALKRAGVDYLHFDAGQVGATIAWFAPGTRFFSSNERIAIAGVPLVTLDGGKATREQYLAYLRQVVTLYGLKINGYEAVTHIAREADHFVLTTDRRGRQRTMRAKRIILATGGTASPRLLGIPGEDRPHVSHYFRDPHDYFNTNLLVVGGKNSAVEAALRSYQAGANVSLSYRGAALPEKTIKYWLYPEITGLLGAGKITGLFGTTPLEIGADHVRLATADGRVIDHPADFVLLMTGYVADMSLCRLAGVTLEGERQTPHHDPATMQTDVPGVYIAGTAVGGTQDRYSLFIENCHVHVDRIIASLLGRTSRTATPFYERPES